MKRYIKPFLFLVVTILVVSGLTITSNSIYAGSGTPGDGICMINDPTCESCPSGYNENQCYHFSDGCWMVATGDDCK